MDKEFDLVRKILDGDQRKFEQIITLYERLVTHIVFRMVSDDLDREEICQEVFIKVYQNLGGFQFKAKLSTWIGKITYNMCINFIRKEKPALYDDLYREDNQNNEQISFAEKTESLHSRINQPDMLVEKSARTELIRNMIEKLPVQYKIILTMFHLDEFKYDEIAEITGIPEGTIKSHLFRARKMLKENLIAEFEGEELWQ